MVLWRISRHRELGGAGGLRAPGRWHHAGRRVVYLAETAASALLEVCVRTSANDVPADVVLLKIEGPRIRATTIEVDRLPADWERRIDVTRDIGTAWLKANSGALLRVPSAIVPETWNVLLNPAHPRAAQFRIVGETAFPFDTRLKV